MYVYIFWCIGVGWGGVKCLYSYTLAAESIQFHRNSQKRIGCLLILVYDFHF